MGMDCVSPATNFTTDALTQSIRAPNAKSAIPSRMVYAGPGSAQFTNPTATAKPASFTTNSSTPTVSASFIPAIVHPAI